MYNLKFHLILEYILYRCKHRICIHFEAWERKTWESKRFLVEHAKFLKTCNSFSYLQFLTVVPRKLFVARRVNSNHQVPFAYNVFGPRFWPLSLFSSRRISLIWQGKGGVRASKYESASSSRRRGTTSVLETGEEMAHSTELKRNSIVSEQCVPFRWNGCYLDTRETEKSCHHCSPTLMVTNNANLKKSFLLFLFFYFYFLPTFSFLFSFLFSFFFSERNIRA